MTSRIMGTGSYLPELAVTNDDLAKIMDTSDEWISSRTGIRQRRLVKDETTPVEISIDAENWKKAKLAVILIDEYGNEKKLVLDKKDFK